jgi:hypothetical protein
MLVVNLTFSDFCMTTMELPVSIKAVVSNKWIWGAPLCGVYGAVGALFVEFQEEEVVARLMLLWPQEPSRW